MKMKRFVSFVLSAISVFSMASLIACEKNTNTEQPEQKAPSKTVVLANFEQFNPDFQLLRLRQGFGAVNVNEEADYVKSGKASAKLQPLGRYKDKLDPVLYFELNSELYDYFYADLDYLYSVSMWMYNAQDEQKQVDIGVVTSTTGLDGVPICDGAITYKLNPGWNKLTYFPDKSELYLPSGTSEALGIYLQFENIPSRDINDAPVYYVDDVVLTVKNQFNEISVVEPNCPNQGDVVKIPKATIKGGEVTATVYYNGKQVSVNNNTFVAENSGEYVVAYQAMVDGFLYKKNIEIFVKSANALDIISFDQESDLNNFVKVACIEKVEWMHEFEGEEGVAKITINRDWPRISFKPAHDLSSYADYEYLILRAYVPVSKNQLTWLNLCDATTPIGYDGHLKTGQWVTYKFPIKPFLERWTEENVANGTAYIVGNSTSYIHQGDFYIAEIYAM